MKYNSEYGFESTIGMVNVSTPIGIIVPTYNRVDTLLLCLRRLEAQTFPDFEVVVVDDGSTDSTPEQMEAYRAASGLRLTYIRQSNGGPARARNVAIAALKSPICIMIGDDILVSQDFVAAHHRFHVGHPGQSSAAIGLTRWSGSGQVVTRFMKWLDCGQLQFAYEDLESGVHPDWQHFYTSNLSLKTQLLRKFPFNERFKKAAWEDIELGYRIQRKHGLDLCYLPEAKADHLHPTSFRQACRRNVEVGRGRRIFADLWPEWQPTPAPPFRAKLRNTLLRHDWLLSPLVAAADLLTRICVPNPLMRLALKYHHAKGYYGLTNQ